MRSAAAFRDTDRWRPRALLAPGSASSSQEHVSSADPFQAGALERIALATLPARARANQRRLGRQPMSEGFRATCPCEPLRSRSSPWPPGAESGLDSPGSRRSAACIVATLPRSIGWSRGDGPLRAPPWLPPIAQGGLLLHDPSSFWTDGRSRARSRRPARTPGRPKSAGKVLEECVEIYTASRQ